MPEQRQRIFVAFYSLPEKPKIGVFIQKVFYINLTLCGLLSVDPRVFLGSFVL